MKLDNHSRSHLALFVIALSACTLNESGNLRAKPGDTSRPADRGSPIDELRAACGSGARTTDGHVIRRQPYLQQVTSTSAMIGWVSTAPSGERVDVTMPGGAPILSATATVEKVGTRAAGENQMWAQLDDLEPDTIYCYSLANGSSLSERTGFRTAPLEKDDQAIRFLAFGDSGGGGSDQRALLDQMFQFPSDLIIHTGDIAYDDGTIGEFEDNVFTVYAELFRNLPFFPASGNHDYRTGNGAPFRDVFALPGDNGEQWYSYDWGRIHFVALDTEADYAKQAAWLDQDLANNALPWTIVYLHRPPYSSGDHGSDLGLRRVLAPVVEKHGVQLVLAGHDHNYERIKPQNGVAYVVTGGGGRGTRNVGTSSFTGFAAEVIHFVYVEVGVDELVLHAIDAMGVEFDSMVIPRTRQGDQSS